MMHRPDAIRWFERLYFASLLLGLVPLALDWEGTIAGVEADWMIDVVIGAIAIGTAINLLLLYFIARRRSNAAKWIAVAFFAISVPAIGSMIAEDGLFVLGSLVTIASALLALAALLLLFGKPARAWFRGEREAGEIADAFR